MADVTMHADEKRAARPDADAAPDVRPVHFRGGGFQTEPRRFVGLAVFAVLLVVWELGSRAGIISELVLPAPSEAWGAFMDLARSGNLQRHLGASLQRLVIGFTAGSILGLIVGTAIGLSSYTRGGRRAAGLGDLSDPQDRAFAAVHHLVRYRRRLEGRDDPVRLLLSRP